MTAKEKLLTDCPFLRGKLTEEAINYIVISMKCYAEDGRKEAFEAAKKASLGNEKDRGVNLNDYCGDNVYPLFTNYEDYAKQNPLM